MHICSHAFLFHPLPTHVLQSVPIVSAADMCLVVFCVWAVCARHSFPIQTHCSPPCPFVTDVSCQQTGRLAGWGQKSQRRQPSGSIWTVMDWFSSIIEKMKLRKAKTNLVERTQTGLCENKNATLNNWGVCGGKVVVLLIMLRNVQSKKEKFGVSVSRFLFWKSFLLSLHSRCLLCLSCFF